MATMIGQLPPAPLLGGELVINFPGRPPQVYTLRDQDVRLGRAADNDLVIPDEFVSRYQAKLKWTGDGYELVPRPTAPTRSCSDGSRSAGRLLTTAPACASAAPSPASAPAGLPGRDEAMTPTAGRSSSRTRPA
jgi:hypothetical protein